MSEFATKRRQRDALELPLWPGPTPPEYDGHKAVPNERDGDHGRERRCSCCREWLPAGDVHFHFLATRGHFDSECRDCKAAKARAYRRRVRFFARVKAARRSWRKVVIAKRAAWKEPQKQVA